MPRMSQKVIAVNIETKKLLYFSSYKAATNRGFISSKIGQVCRGEYLHHFNHFWFHLSEFSKERLNEAFRTYEFQNKLRRDFCSLYLNCRKCNEECYYKDIAKNGQKNPYSGRVCRKCASKKSTVYKNKNELTRLRSTLRIRTYQAIKAANFRKKSKLFEYLGCSIESLKSHIETQFRPGMDWSNYTHSGWHIDHIIPLSSAKTEEDLYKLCHYTNLQPLWAQENLKKGKGV